MTQIENLFEYLSLCWSIYQNATTVKLTTSLNITLPFAKISTKMTELGALPPGWDTKFDPRTGR